MAMASIFFFVNLLLLGTVFGNLFLTPRKKIENSTGDLKIIDGEYTTIEKYPRDVAVLISNNVWGVGALIAPNWVLTVAFNCLWVDPTYITVRARSSYWDHEGLLVQVDACIIHPNYTGTFANNIALVKLSSNITDSPTSRLAVYNYQTSLKIPDKTYQVTGWGVRSSNYTKEKQLQYTLQTIMTDEECNKFYDLTEATGSFCAKNPNGGPCVFDYGGMLNEKKKLVGMYQGSTDCTQPKTYPSLYVDIYAYKGWITDTMAKN